jgi:hypothetical protein
MTQTGNFEFYDNYAESARKLQPELYEEINNILNNEFVLFFNKFNRKPIILDIGSAGLLPYDLNLVEKCVLLDLFNKPDVLLLASNCEWIVGDILSENFPLSLQGNGGYDFIVMSSLLHHLCDKHNNIINNLDICFSNSNKLLSNTGKICIFESTCSNFLTKIEDVFYPLYSRILAIFFKFTFTRIVSQQEILISLKKAGLNIKIMQFKQPKYIAQMFWRIPTKFYPLKIDAIFASHYNH